jgi:hypothetical protein
MDQSFSNKEEDKPPQMSSNDTQTTAEAPLSRNPTPETKLPDEKTSTESQMASGNEGNTAASVMVAERSVSGGSDTITPYSEDPYALRSAVREDTTKRTLRQHHPQGRVRKIKKYYNRQNALIDAYLGSLDEEAAEIEDNLQNGGKVKFAVYGSSTVNFFLFIIQLYAAVSTGSLSLFGTAADAFVGYPNLVTHCTQLTVQRWTW